MPRASGSAVRWYRSFYFRIGFSFVVFVVAVLVAHSVMFSVMVARPPFRGRSPNNLAAIVAADLGSALTQDPMLDVEAYLPREYADLQPMYVVMKNGPTAANRPAPLQDDIRRSVQEALAGTDFRRAGIEPALGGPPVVMAPIQIANELRGMVVLPPAPPPSPVA